jgi:hypothetical protein
MGLSGGVNFCQLDEIRMIHGLIDHVAIKGNHKINVLGRISECALPQAFGIGGTLPGTVIFVIDYLA